MMPELRLKNACLVGIEGDTKMKIEIQRSVDKTTIKVEGRVDGFTAHALASTLYDNLDGSETVVLEMSGVEYVSDEGLGVLVGAHEKIQPRGSLRLTGVCDGVIESMRARGIADVLLIG